MKRIILISIALLAAAACRQAQDTRYFAPAVEFGSAQYAVSAADGGLDIDIRLSRPASQAFNIGLNVDSSLEEGIQYQISSQTVAIAAGQQDASVHVALVDDEIWVESAWIELILKPGERYTLDPAKSVARVDISKEIKVPIFRLISPEDVIVTNPYLAETFGFQLEGDRNTDKDLEVELAFGDLVYGTDYRIVGSDGPVFTYRAGARSQVFQVEILKKDESGFDREAVLTVVPKRGQYSVDPDHGSAPVHLSDPVVDFKPLFRTAAANDGQGYQMRQAFLGADGTWIGNTNADMWVSSEGSNYLRTFRNMYDHPSFNCRANASASQMFRLSDLFPNYLYPNATAILDYGNDQGHREFSPADSLMRFVLDKGETKKGSIHLGSPRTFVAFIGSYAAWQDKSSGENAWVKDSRATKGDIFASTHSAITGRISVTLEKLEGRFDLTDLTQPILVTAWFSSDSDMFMKADEANGKTPATTYAVSQEDGIWKVEYKIWPR
jgi:hypothetical protein